MDIDLEVAAEIRAEARADAAFDQELEEAYFDWCEAADAAQAPAMGFAEWYRAVHRTLPAPAEVVEVDSDEIPF